MRGWARGIAGLGLLGAVLYSSSCYALSAGWDGPGWYQIETDRYMGAAAVAGPFKTKSECEATLGRSDEEATNVCTYFGSKEDFEKL
jgi:hypothetical protein